MHGFCDSSLNAYSAMVYLKVLTKEKCFVRLLSAKSKVAPHKTLTVPRVELLVCHLLSKLVDSVKRAIRMIVKVDEVYLILKFVFGESNLLIRSEKLGWRIGQMLFVL